MKFEIDMDKLRSAIVARKGVKTFEMLANEAEVSPHLLSDICNNAKKKYIENTTNYFSICYWLGVSAYHFMRIEGESETIGTYDKLKNR